MKPHKLIRLYNKIAYKGCAYRHVRNPNGTSYVTVYNRELEPVTTLLTIARARQYINKHLTVEQPPHA